MIKRGSGLLSRVLLGQSHFSGKLNFQRVAFMMQKQQQGFSFFNFHQKKKTLSFEDIFLQEQVKLEYEIKQIENLTKEEKWIVFQLEYQQRLSDYQEHEFNKDGSYSKKFAHFVIQYSFDMLFEMSFHFQLRRFIAITETEIPKKLINILSNLKEEPSLSVKISLLNIIQQTYFLYRNIFNTQTDEVVKNINQHQRELENIILADHKSDDKFLINYRILLMVYNFFISNFFHIRQQYTEETYYMNQGFSQLIKTINHYKSIQDHQLLLKIYEEFVLKLYKSTKLQRFFLPKEYSTQVILFHQKLIEVFELPPEFVFPEEVLKLKIQFKDVLTFYRVELEIKKIEKDIENYMVQHNLSYDKSMKLTLKLGEYRRLRRQESGLDEISKELDKIQVEESDDVDCLTSWFQVKKILFQYQQMQFLHELNEGQYEKSKFRFDQMLLCLQQLLISEDFQNLIFQQRLNTIDQNLIDEIIVTKDLPDRRYCLSKLHQIFQENIDPTIQDLITYYNFTALSFCLSQYGETSKIQCFEMLEKFMINYRPSDQSIYYSKLVDLCFLAIEETNYFQDLRAFITKIIKQLNSSETIIEKGEVIQQLNNLLKQLEDKERKAKGK